MHGALGKVGVVFFCMALGACANENHCAHRLQFADGDCSATAVGAHTLLTAAHCVDHDTLTAVDGKPARVLWLADDGHDHALIGVTVKFPAWIVKRADPIAGERVSIIGNPGDESGMYRHGYVAGASAWQGKPVELYELPIWFGDSGAGILDSRGRLVGVISGVHWMDRDTITDGFAVSYPLAFTQSQWALVH